MNANNYIREVEVKFKTKPRDQDKVKIGCPSDAVKLFSDLQNETQEKTIALHLDTRSTVTCFQIVFVGTSNSTLFDPKTILRTALLTNACSIILIHNHPSGDPQPSEDDINCNLIMSRACKHLNIQLLDFLIIGDAGLYFSFSEKGILKPKEQNQCQT